MIHHIAMAFAAGWQRLADWFARGQIGPAPCTQCRL